MNVFAQSQMFAYTCRQRNASRRTRSIRLSPSLSLYCYLTTTTTTTRRAWGEQISGPATPTRRRRDKRSLSGSELLTRRRRDRVAIAQFID